MKITRIESTELVIPWLDRVSQPMSAHMSGAERTFVYRFVTDAGIVGVGEGGETYNINADTAAGKIAATLQAAKLVMLTDIAGVLDENGELISRMTPKRADELRRNGIIKGGMIPKLETCLNAVANGVGAAHILDGRLPHVLLLEAFTAAGVGTMIEA